MQDSAGYRTSVFEAWFVFWRDLFESKYPWRDRTVKSLYLFAFFTLPYHIDIDLLKCKRYFKLPLSY